MIKYQMVQASKAQEPHERWRLQDMIATRHEISISMLRLKHLKQLRDEEQKSTNDTRHEQHKKSQGKIQV